MALPAADRVKSCGCAGVGTTRFGREAPVEPLASLHAEFRRRGYHGGHRRRNILQWGSIGSIDCGCLYLYRDHPMYSDCPRRCRRRGGGLDRCRRPSLVGWLCSHRLSRPRGNRHRDRRGIANNIGSRPRRVWRHTVAACRTHAQPRDSRSRKSCRRSCSHRRRPYGRCTVPIWKRAYPIMFGALRGPARLPSWGAGGRPGPRPQCIGLHSVKSVIGVIIL